MEMLNRAIEDASDYSAFRRVLTDEAIKERMLACVEETASFSEAAFRALSRSRPVLDKSPKRPGENREQYRARVYGNRRR